MSDRKNTNKYYPPDYDPARHGSINAYHGSHPLRERAARAHLGILTIRFEMPFAVICLTCGAHLDKGVRFNADKQRAGAYLSTPIWQFTMTCPSCSSTIVVRTDPEHRTYAMVQGVRVKPVAQADEAEAREAGVLILDDAQERAERHLHPMRQLEHESDDRRRAVAQSTRVDALARVQDRMADDFGVSRMMRKHFRDQKHTLASKTAEAQQRGLSFHLLDPSESDREQARNAFSTTAPAPAAMLSSSSSSSSSSLDAWQRQRRIDQLVRVQSKSIFSARRTIAAPSDRLIRFAAQLRVDHGTRAVRVIDAEEDARTHGGIAPPASASASASASPSSSQTLVASSNSSSSNSSNSSNTSRKRSQPQAVSPSTKRATLSDDSSHSRTSSIRFLRSSFADYESSSESD